MKFNGKNYNGFVYINDQKLSLTEAEPQIREWFFGQIQVESGLYSNIESVKNRAIEKWSKVNIEEAKQLLSKVTVDRLIDHLYTPSQAWSGVCKKYNLNNL